MGEYFDLSIELTHVKNYVPLNMFGLECQHLNDQMIERLARSLKVSQSIESLARKCLLCSHEVNTAFNRKSRGRPKYFITVLGIIITIT